MKKTKTGKMLCLFIIFSFFFTGKVLLCGEAGECEPLSPELKALLEKMHETNLELETVKADVVYSRTIPLLDDNEHAAGRLIFRPPDMLRLSLKGERRDEEVVSDGTTWWLKDHEARKVEVYDADSGSEMAESAFLTLGYGRKTDELKEEYIIRLLSSEKVEYEVSEEEKETKKMWHLLFKTRNDERAARYERIEIKVSDRFYLPEKIVLHESGGEFIHTYDLENILVNDESDLSEFSPDIPRGYNIIQP